ncbi:helix-turn-helix domain-containing protein [Enterococcus faecalis]
MKYVNIRSIREDNDLTQQEMSKLLNVSQNTYS